MDKVLTDERLELVLPVLELPSKNTLADIRGLESDEELDTEEENEKVSFSCVLSHAVD